MSDETRFDDETRSAEEGPREEETIKVNDRRMFTAEGELREEYQFLEDEESEDRPSSAGQQRAESERGEPAESAASTPPQSGAAPDAAAAPTPGGPGEAAASPSPGQDQEAPGAMGSPTFYDLVSILAEPVAVYLGDATMPDGRNAENLELARLHIDLLELLKEKTEGNRDSQESAVLDDLLYRLRMRYVQKRG